LALPKLTLVGLILSCGWPEAPLPLKLIRSGEPGALLAIEILPAAEPDETGENFAVKEALCPALIVAGSDKPLIVKPVPEAAAWAIVRLAVPKFVKIIGADPLPPTRMLPKLTFDGFAESAP